MGLHNRRVALYSGTLGLKHDPEHLVAVAQALAPKDEMLLVVTEGIGRDHLERRKSELGLNGLRLLDYVDYESLPDLLGTADVSLVLLEPSAGAFSVPSKILAYLAAGRPIVGAMPTENLASQTIVRAGAGVVVAPGDHAAFADAAVELLRAPGRATAMGIAAREYAERTFDIERITDEIEAMLEPA